MKRRGARARRPSFFLAPASPCPAGAAWSSLPARAALVPPRGRVSPARAWVRPNSRTPPARGGGCGTASPPSPPRAAADPPTAHARTRAAEGPRHSVASSVSSSIVGEVSMEGE
eukprot:12654766-Alexandrium_andersonii.AAC.1